MTGGVANGGAWRYLGAGTVNERDGNRIRLPDGVFEAGLLAWPAGCAPDATTDGGDRRVPDGGEPAGVEAHWSYESISGTPILSDGRLEDQPRFKWIGERTVGGPSNPYQVTIPKEFFPDCASDLERVPGKALVRYGEQRHFVTRGAMLDADPASCYVVTRDRLSDMIGGLDELEKAYGEVPSFLR
jgi:hypothetical protein